MLKYFIGVAGGAAAAKVSIGTSDTAASATDTTLTGDTKKAIEVRSYSRPSGYVSAVYTSAEANFTWNEMGLFDTNDVLITRIVLDPAIVKTAANRARVQWQLVLERDDS